VSAPLYTRRRRRRHGLAYAVCVACGLAIGIGGSMLRPGHWWAGDADPLNRPERPPQPREVLCLAGECVYVAEVLPFDDDRVAVLIWLRGRTGRDAYRVTDCSVGEGVAYSVANPRQRHRWQRGGAGLVDRIAEAACGPAERV
jgi:hypothetical protein